MKKTFNQAFGAKKNENHNADKSFQKIMTGYISEDIHRKMKKLGKK